MASSSQILGVDGMLFNALRGNDARADELLAPLLGDPGELPEDWRLMMRSPPLAPVATEPRVIASVRKMEADFAQQAVRYRELVASGEIVVP